MAAASDGRASRMIGPDGFGEFMVMAEERKWAIQSFKVAATERMVFSR